MKAIEIVEAIKNRKGQHVAIAWQRPCKTVKAYTGIIAKRTETFVRTGIDYANLASVKAGIASGERDEVGSLPWGQWRAGFEKYIIDHNGKEYIRLYPASFANLHPSVEYTVNGQRASYGDVEPFLLASEKRDKNDESPTCFTVNADSIVSIGD